MANSSNPESFLVQPLLQINDVQTKIKEKANVNSAVYFSKDDPKPFEVQLRAKFGTDNPGYLSVHFQLKVKIPSLKLLKISVINREGQLLKTRKTENVNDLSPFSSLGWEKVLPLNQITESELVILCDMEYSPLKSASLSVDKFNHQLQTDLIHMFESAAFADVIFLVEGEKIAAHKTILASRSTYFKTMFDTNMKEKITNQVEISDVGPETFKVVLKFLYGGIPEEKQFEPLVKLIVASDKYIMDELKEICESAIIADLQVENVVDALLIADMHNCQRLLRAAKTLFKARTAAVKKNHAKWKELAERPSLMLGLLELFAEEDNDWDDDDEDEDKQ